MGATGSLPDVYPRNVDKQGKVMKKPSFSTCLSHHPSVKEKFFPPPILHTKQVNGHSNNSEVDFTDSFRSSLNSEQENGGHVVIRKRTVDNDSFSKTPSKKFSGCVEQKFSGPLGKKSIRDHRVRRRLSAKISSASSTSSGVGSVSEDDDENECGEKRKSSNSSINPVLSNVSKRKAKDLSLPIVTRQSMDSGTIFDEECSDSPRENCRENFIINRGEKDEKDNFETVFEENEFDGTTMEAEGKSQSNLKFNLAKKIKKYSFADSLRKMRKRARSLPATFATDLIRKREKPSLSLFGSSNLDREWEIVGVDEICRRLSLDQVDQVVLPLPEGATSSQILDESMSRQLVDVLPARAAGYPWINIYNSEKHGFSLHTFYRKMIDWDEEMSPILLVILDCASHVFGAIVSTAIRPSEHFFGTGDSCLLFKYVSNPDTEKRELRTYCWSGENQFFVKASWDSLSIGAGSGRYGLWLDSDFNHGRSQRCETFQNEPLSGEEGDFTIQLIEAFGFRMG